MSTSTLSTPTRTNDLGSLGQLLTLNGIEPTKQAQPELPAFTGKLNAFYSTVRNGQTTRIFLIEVKKDTVKYKNHPADKHSNTMPLAKFLKFYK